MRSKRALRAGNWKLHEFGGNRYELYDLSNDIGEMKDLAKEKPQMLEQLKTMIKQAAR